MIEIHMGIPEMEEFWNGLTNKVKFGKASKDGRNDQIVIIPSITKRADHLHVL